MNIASEVEKFIEQWLKSLVAMQKAIEEKNFVPFRDYETLQGIHEGGNTVNRQGYLHLENAAELLLRQERLEQKLVRQTAVDALVKAHFARLPKVKAGGNFSAAAIVERAKRTVHAAPRVSGGYVYPVVFAPGAHHTDWGFGPLRIVSKAIFMQRHSQAFEAERSAPDSSVRSKLLSDWEDHSEAYDHFVTVAINDHEWAQAQRIGREAAEFFLNIVRMYFSFYHTDDIRVGGGYIFETRQSALYFDQSGSAHFSSSKGPFGTQIEDGWTDAMNHALSGIIPVLGSYLSWFTQGTDPQSPIQERIRYASMLIAEAYAEPFDHIRLVRLVSALEALALVERQDKTFQLALHCSYVGGHGETERACAIFDAVKRAYGVRNAVVHGDMPDNDDVRGAFFNLEKHALYIFLGFISVFAEIQAANRPQSINHLRRLLKKRVCMFFWMPEIAA